MGVKSLSNPEAESLSYACREIANRILSLPNPGKEEAEKTKVELAKHYGLRRIPQNSEILRAVDPEEARRLAAALGRKKVRSISGVNVVAVMTRPWPCPHGKCSYCPGGVEFNSPQSYTGFEPAALRGWQHGYDPYLQVQSRMRQLREIGHEVDKVELIIMGGTFTAMPQSYQRGFVKGCLDGIMGRETSSLEESKRLMETSRPRNVGLTIETRPDWAGEKEINLMLELGATKVELGVQAPYDDVYTRINRCHTVSDVIKATRLLKDSAFKLCYHMMLGLPGSSPPRDLKAFQMIFQSPEFRPDMVKIYPCLVLKGTEIYEWWAKGEYRPYTTAEAVELLAEIKRLIPPWVRVMRIQRDIPANLIVDGVKKSNLRELALRRLSERGERCRCVRCREVGHRSLKEGVEIDPAQVKMLQTRYEASGGLEVFLSFEDPARDVLVGYLRLRIPSPEAFRPEIAGRRAALIRELHVYGRSVPVGVKAEGGWQHRGYGAALLQEAEKLASEEFDCRKILVISALGTKRYYARFGYDYDGPYMSKPLN